MVRLLESGYRPDPSDVLERVLKVLGENEAKTPQGTAADDKFL